MDLRDRRPKLSKTKDFAKEKEELRKEYKMYQSSVNRKSLQH